MVCLWILSVFKTTGRPISKESILICLTRKISLGTTVEWAHVNSNIEKDLYDSHRRRSC